MVEFCADQRQDLVEILLKDMHARELLEELVDAIPENEVIDILMTIAEDYGIDIEEETESWD